MATSVTRKQILKMVKKRPDITGQQIADKLGISRQRVSVVARKMGIQLRTVQSRENLPNCAMCGKPLKWPGTMTHAKCHLVKVRCSGCGIVFKRTRRDKARSKHQYHSRDCFTDAIARRAARKRRVA